MDRLPEVALRPVGRIGRRERAAALQARMLSFRAVYNAACLVRDSWHGTEERRQRCIGELAAVVATELQRTVDHEALMYAIADSLYCSPLGVPWEA